MLDNQQEPFSCMMIIFCHYLINNGRHKIWTFQRLFKRNDHHKASMIAISIRSPNKHLILSQIYDLTHSSLLGMRRSISWSNNNRNEWEDQWECSEWSRWLVLRFSWKYRKYFIQKCVWLRNWLISHWNCLLSTYSYITFDFENFIVSSIRNLRSNVLCWLSEEKAFLIDVKPLRYNIDMNSIIYRT